MRVIAFTKYDRAAASTRQRVLQYAPPLAKRGIELSHTPLLSDSYVRSLETGERWSRGELLRSYARRLLQLLSKPKCDIIWIHAELFPYLPFAFEKLVFRSGIPVVVDCDDAFFLTYNEHPNRMVKAVLSGKIDRLIRGAAAVTCGNDFLRDYTASLCPNTMVVPTVVDTDIYRPVDRAGDGPPVIGWIGSPSTWQYVKPLLPLLERLCASGRARFRAIGPGWRAEPDRFPGLELVPWSETNEVAEVQGFDIGIMPLIDTPWARAKSGYKLIQYMACGIPSVASPIGVNASILEENTGILATDLDEWERALASLVEDADLRRRRGQGARQRAVSRYSLAVQTPRIAELFEGLAH